ncbi:hypothetical protein FNV43_RR08068 [Rhamnella rubrinervis]|uniref:GDSL esterase/lipase 1-like n=1 Tax=Rhamnella rubrinervis TaxID=2594499 RepID=A0A8K0MMX8_9ROSA|nr:hypothetical protein FNV43_RR08068 [Rhamnella rubrinervis]
MRKLSFRICLFVFCTTSVVLTDASPGLLKNHVPSLFIFGDSIFDAGNNNYINTTFYKANYPPYGETFFKHPTGRFSDGRLFPDFIAECEKLPLIPPYLQPQNHEFTNGVNFASAGSGALVETNQGIVIDLKTQLAYFKNVSRLLRQKLDGAQTNYLLSRAVYLFSVGGNDYAVPFLTNSSVLRSYSHQQFVGLVIGNLTSVIKEIYKIGGRKFGFLNILPISCTPAAKAILGGGKCFEQITPYVKFHNKQLPKLLHKLRSELKGFKYSFFFMKGFKYSVLPFYSFLDHRIKHPNKYGFKEVKSACCGSGPYRGILSCGGKRGVTEYFLCENVSEYVFFDSAHPPEKANLQFVKQSWNGNSGRLTGSLATMRKSSRIDDDRALLLFLQIDDEMIELFSSKSLMSYGCRKFRSFSTGQALYS